MQLSILHVLVTVPQAKAMSWAKQLARECSLYHKTSGENLGAGYSNWSEVTWAWYKVGEGKVKNAGSYIFPSNNEEGASWVKGDRTRGWQPYKEHK